MKTVQSFRTATAGADRYFVAADVSPYPPSSPQGRFFAFASSANKLLSVRPLSELAKAKAQEFGIYFLNLIEQGDSEALRRLAANLDEIKQHRPMPDAVRLALELAHQERTLFKNQRRPLTVRDVISLLEQAGFLSDDGSTAAGKRYKAAEKQIRREAPQLGIELDHKSGRPCEKDVTDWNKNRYALRLFKQAIGKITVSKIGTNSRKK